MRDYGQHPFYGAGNDLYDDNNVAYFFKKIKKKSMDEKNISIKKMSDTSDTASGNTSTSADNSKKTKKGPIRSRNWVFTWNNYDDTSHTHIQSLSDTYIYQEETGENGTKHLQGYIEFKNAISFDSIKKKLPKCHIEKCKSKEDAILYCQKEDTRTGSIYNKNIPINLNNDKLEDPMDGLTRKMWQLEIMELMATKPDKRTINWFWSKKGGTGKSTFTKHLMINHNAICVSGKAADIKHGVTMHIQNKKCIDLVVIDIPRTCEQKFVSYEAIEQIKNGCFFNSKYETSMVLFNPPHIIVFSNVEPEYERMSEDRWNVKCIDE